MFLRNEGFTFDVQAIYYTHMSNVLAGLNRQDVNGTGVSIAASASYRIDLSLGAMARRSRAARSPWAGASTSDELIPGQYLNEQQRARLHRACSIHGASQPDLFNFLAHRRLGNHCTIERKPPQSF